MAAVFLDPGHGGRDPGSLTRDGRREADSNLRLALILAPMLLTAGHSVKLSRQKDEFIYTYHRARMAWEWGADLLISLHCDVATSPKPSGHHVVCSVTDKPGERSNKLAWLLVQQIAGATGRPPFKRTDGPVWSRLSDKDPKRDWYGLIRYAVQYGWMVPVIVERGFLSNPEDARLLFDDEYLRMQAEGIVQAINRYGF